MEKANQREITTGLVSGLDHSMMELIYALHFLLDGD